MKIEIYKDKKKEWRWRLKAKNGRIVAVCGEGYRNKQHCVRMTVKLFYGLAIKGE